MVGLDIAQHTLGVEESGQGGIDFVVFDYLLELFQGRQIATCYGVSIA